MSIEGVLMHISIYQLIAGVALIAGIVAIIWLLTIAFRRERYTREKFAFVALTGFFSMAASAVSALAHKETPWGSAVNLVKETMGMTTQADPPRVADHVLMVVVLFLVAAVVIRFYEKWDGAVSVRHYTKDRYHEAAPLIIEGLAEAKRIIKRDPPLEIYASEQNRSFASVQDQPEETLVWHLQARDLILLRSPSY